MPNAIKEHTCRCGHDETRHVNCGCLEKVKEPKTGYDYCPCARFEEKIMEDHKMEELKDEVQTESPTEKPDPLLSMITATVLKKMDVEIATRKKDIEKLVEKTMLKLAIPRKISIEYAEKKPVTVKGAHKQMEVLLKLVSSVEKKNFYLYGESGSGKSTGAHLLAKALGLKYWYVSLNPQSPASLVIGYKDAMGNYHATGFRELYQNGGIVCIDEMDNASDTLLSSLNSTLENGHGSFPDGLIKRHPDLIVIGTGNTCGLGANQRYPGRRPFDTAFAERFYYLSWEYDEKQEREIARAINPDQGVSWAEYIQYIRKTAEEYVPKLIVSPRASYQGACLLKAGFKVSEILEMLVFKGCDRMVIKKLNLAKFDDKAGD